MSSTARFISLLLTIAIVLSSVPATTFAAAGLAAPHVDPSYPAASKPPAADQSTALGGALRYPIELDGDGDPATNPTARPVPINRFGSIDQVVQPVHFAQIQLGVEVAPTDPKHNPAGTLVTFRVWNNAFGAGRVDLKQAVRADAWGAALAQFTLDDEHLLPDTPYYYQVSAPHFTQTEVRAFTFDFDQIGSDVQLGAARLTAHVAADGRVILDLASDLPIDDDVFAAQIQAARLTDAAPELLPALAARRLDDHHARAELYLDAGRYVFMATITSGANEAHSAPVTAEVKRVTPPPVERVENILSIDPAGRSGLVQYRTPDGDAALLRRSLTDLPRSAPRTAPPSPKSNTFTQVTRLGAFKVLAEEYRIDLETVTDDGQKIITLDGFTYDPIARRYDLTIQSLMDQPVDDKLTVQVFGPNDVLIYEETAPVVLRPDRPTKYSIAVPTDRGEVYGLRVIVHDPAIVQTIIRRLKSSVTGLSAWIKESLSETGNATGFSFSATLKFEVKVLEIMLVAYSLQCASTGTCVYKQEGLVYQPGEQWFDVITLGVRDYLRNTFGAKSIEDALKSLLLEGIPLGTATAALPVGLRVTGGFDTQCLPPHLLSQAKEISADMVRLGKEVAAGLNFAFKQQFETFQGDGVTLPIPPTTFLALKIGPVFAFNVEIDSNGDYGLYVELQWQMGVSAALLLQGFPLAGMLDKVLKAAKLVNNIHGAVEFIRGMYVLLEMVGTFAAADSAFNDADVDKCKKKHTASPRSNPPPPPNGHPDERFDAIEAAFLTEPTGDSGRLAVLNGYVTRAQRLGLPRAEAYWTLRLRQAELVQFDNDTAARLAEQQEIETRTTTALDRIQGLISGTIPITPSATITDAVLSEYDAFVTGLGSTAREQARQVLIDALDFAQAQYAQLRGQELDLQRELRLLLQGTGVGVIDDGLITWALGAIGSVGVDAVPVQIVPGSTLSGLPESRYYTPFEAPPVVIAPSGSLHRFVGSNEARAWLETYAASGGTLIVLAQAHSADWELLPGGQLRGLGYEQDILCKDASVRIVNPSEWLTGLSRDLPNIQLDGSFTTLPHRARVILQRTTGNQLPAMIEYPFGAGRVVAMSLYPDFYVNGMQSPEDMIFARSLFGRAYLTATGESIAARANAHQSIALPLSITNTAATTATVARVSVDYFGVNAAESWRWAAHRIAGLQQEATVNLNPPLPGGQSRTIQANFTAPNYAGLYRSAYRFDYQPYVTPGPFYEVVSPTVGILARPLISLFERNQIDYRYGETAIVTLTLKNEMTTTRTLRLDTLGGSSNISIGPSATITQPVFTGPVFENRVITATLVENGARLAATLTTLSLRPPTFGLDVTPQTINVGLPVTLIVTGTAQQVPPATPLTFELRHNHTLIDQVNTTLSGTLDLTQATAQFSTSAAAANQDFTVRAVISGQPVMTQTIATVTPGRIETVALNGDLTLDTLQPQAASITLNSARSGAVITAQVVLRNDLGVISAGPQAGAIVTDQLRTLGLDVAVPAALDPTRSYTLIYSLTTQLIGSPVTFTQAATLPLSLSGPQLTLDSAVLFPQEPFYFSLTPAPGSRLIAPVGPYTVTLTHAPSAFLFTTVLTGTPSANGLSFNFVAPGLPATGLYQLTVTSPQLFNWSETKAVLVRERALTFESPSSVSAGGTLIASVTSSADLDNPISGTLSLYDFDEQLLSVTSFSGLLAGASRTLNVALPIPANIRSGAYSLRWQGINDLGAPFASSDVVSVNGLDTQIAAQTDRAWYQPGESVTAALIITANPALSNAWLRWQITAAPRPYDLSAITLAGNDWLAEGVGQDARAAFWDMDISPDGTFALIVDRYSRVILRLDLATNEVRWVAGRPALSGIGGTLDGVGREAVFNSPRHIQISADGARAYVLDYGSFRLRRIDLSNYAVTTLAGPGTSYSWRPSGMVISADETFVLFTHIDGFSTGVYRYDLAAQTMTWLGNPDPYFSHSFTDIALNVTGTLAYLPDVISGNVYQLDLSTHAYSIVPDGLSGPLATGDAQLTLSADGQQLYFTDPGGYTVQQLNIVSGTTTTLAGLKNTSGDVDGVGAAARFSTLHDIAVTPDGSLALISLKHGGLARLNLATNTVTTIAGVRASTRDGTGTQARLIKAGGLDVDPTGSFALVVDYAEHTLRRLDLATNALTTPAGAAGQSGSTDGFTQTARFDAPFDVAIHPGGAYALITDQNNHTLRRYDLNTGAVTTLAGAAGQSGSTDGFTQTARFNRPAGVAISPDGTYALLADNYNSVIRRIDLTTGQVTTPYGQPGAYALMDGVGNAARFNGPGDVDISADGRWALVVDTGNRLLRRIDLTTARVTTFPARHSYLGWIQRGVIGPDAQSAVVTMAYENQSYDTALYRIDLLTGRVDIASWPAGFSTGADEHPLWTGVDFISGTTDLLTAQWSGTYVFDSALRRTQLIGGAGAVRRDIWQPVNGGGTFTFTQVITNLPAGSMLVRGELFGPEPSGVITPALRQRLASHETPFVVLGNNPIELTIDHNDWAYGDWNTPMRLNGYLVNTTTLTRSLAVTVTDNWNELLLAQPFTVTPHSVQSFNVQHDWPDYDKTEIAARGSDGSRAALRLSVNDEFFDGVATVEPASIGPGETAQHTLRLVNFGRYLETVTIDYGALATPPTFTLTLQPESMVTITRQILPTGQGTLNLPVKVRSWFERTYTAQVSVGSAVPAAQINLLGPTRNATTAVRSAATGAALTLNYASALTYDVMVNYALNGPITRTGQAALTLVNGSTAVPIVLGAIPTGAYTITFDVRHAKSNVLLTGKQLSFEVVEPNLDLSLAPNALPIDAAGSVTYTIGVFNRPTSDLAFTGYLRLTGVVDQQVPITLTKGQAVTRTGTLNVLGRAGAQTIDLALTHLDGTPLITRTLTLEAAPRLAPALTLRTITATFDAKTNEALIDVTLDNANVGGDAALTINAFDEAIDWLVAASGYGPTSARIAVPAPIGVLSGTYPIEVRLADQSLRTEIAIPGPVIELRHTLDKTIYAPGEVATWRVGVIGLSGPTTSYTVSLRYGTQEMAHQVMVGAGSTVTVTWPITTGTTSDRAGVLVSAMANNGARYTVAVDSQWIHVADDPRAQAVLSTDRADSGETITLTLNLTPTRLAMVFAPDIGNRPGALLWSSLSVSTTEVISGAFVMTYTLPATMPSGRYSFRYLYDGEERAIPVDVKGIDLKVLDLQAPGPASPLRRAEAATPLTIKARLKVDRPVSEAVIIAYAFAPDGTYVNLGSSAILTTNLAAGVTPVELTGVFNAAQPGLYQIALDVMGAGSSPRLSSERTYLEVGAAAIKSLTLDKGHYLPNEPASGEVTVFGSGNATVNVKTSGGTTLLQQTLPLTGYHTLNFTAPTHTERDEVLIATLTDTLGFTSTRQIAYKVAAALDITAPQVALLSPVNYATLAFTDTLHRVTVTGVVTEDTAIDRVLINGQPISVTGSAFTAVLTLTAGGNVFDAAAIDRAGNIGLGSLYVLYGEPSFGVTLSANPINLNVGGQITFTTVITASDPLTVTVRFPFSALHPNRSAGTISTGTLVLTDTVVTWAGFVSPQSPATVQWRSSATQAMTQTAYALVEANQLLARKSNEVSLDIEGGPVERTLYLPLMRR